MDNCVSRIRKDDIFSLYRCALVWLVDVGHEDVGQAIHRLLSLVLSPSMSSRGGANNVHPRAVHVHFAIADEVEPSPGKQNGARRSEVWDGKIIRQGDRASSNHRLDDLEILAIVVRERKLARAPSVLCSADDGHVVLLACLVRGSRSDRGLRLESFAWKICA